MVDYGSILLDAIKENPNDAKWADAKYGGIKLVSNTAVGNVGQTFIRLLCKDLGYDAKPPKDAAGQELKQSPWDLMINGKTFEIKTASEDVSGAFQFNHIRLHREYEGLICLGIAPDCIYFGIWSKAEVATSKAGHLVSMEKGGASDFKLTKKPSGLSEIDEFQKKLDDILQRL